MTGSAANGSRSTVCVVNYFNTLPLVWGFLKEHSHHNLEMVPCLPSQCADLLKSGRADVGIVSSIEVPRQGLDHGDSLGIASDGYVRSLLLLSKVPIGKIRALAVDAGSRTTTILVQILLRLRYGVSPQVLPRQPELPSMMDGVDAAVIIGDPALRIDVELSDYLIMDLGHEWQETTELPMVYAVWAGRSGKLTRGLLDALQASYQYGKTRIDEIVTEGASERDIGEKLAQKYLTEHIVYELGERHRRGLSEFWRLAEECDLVGGYY